MRILVAHNRYQFSGGEDAVVRDEIKLLRKHGHIVELLEQDNDAIHSIYSKLIASSSIFYSTHSRKRMKEAIGDIRPEIIHVHNWFPMLSPSIFVEADTSNIPIVQTLHNFRMICANALLYRDGAVCTDCVGKLFPVDAIVHGCYRNSRAGSAIVAAAFAYHRLAHTWDGVDQFIAISGFEREILISGGLPAERVAVKPNFVGSEIGKSDGKTEDAALFAGRLSPEKGIRTMLSAWNSGRISFRLKIVGDGPLKEEVTAFAAKNSQVEYLGFQTPEAVYSEMARARFLVFPSEWYETFGRTVIEAFSQGTPVLAADLGGVRELVSEGVTGYCFPPGDVNTLVEKTLCFSASEEYKRMRLNCRSLFLSKYTAEVNYTLLEEIYAKAISIRNLRRKTA